MKRLRSVALGALMLAVMATFAHAQRGGGGGAGGGLGGAGGARGGASRGGAGAMRGGAGGEAALPSFGDQKKQLLKDIKLTKAEDDSIKKIEKTFEAERKKVEADAKKSTEENGTAGGAGGGRGGARAGGGRGNPEMMREIQGLLEDHIVMLREVLTDEQAKTFDANLAAMKKKEAEARQARGGRGRGAGG